jgi:hypothetical protein
MRTGRSSVAPFAPARDAEGVRRALIGGTRRGPAFADPRRVTAGRVGYRQLKKQLIVFDVLFAVPAVFLTVRVTV